MTSSEVSPPLKKLVQCLFLSYLCLERIKHYRITQNIFVLLLFFGKFNLTCLPYLKAYKAHKSVDNTYFRQVQKYWEMSDIVCYERTALPKLKLWEGGAQIWSDCHFSW